MKVLVLLFFSVYSLLCQAQSSNCKENLKQNTSEVELLKKVKSQVHFDLKYTNATASRWQQCWNSEDKTFGFEYPDLKESFKQYCDRTRIKISSFFENEWLQMRQALALNRSSEGALRSGDSQVLSPTQYLPETLPKTDQEIRNWNYFANSVIAQDITHQLSGFRKLQPLSDPEILAAFKKLNDQQDQFYASELKINADRKEIKAQLEKLNSKERAKLQYKKDLTFKTQNWQDQYLASLKKAPMLAHHGPEPVSTQSINQSLQRFHYSSFQQLRNFELKMDDQSIANLASQYPLVFERVIRKNPEFCQLGEKIQKQSSTWNTVKNVGLMTTMVGAAFYLCRGSATRPQKIFGSLGLFSSDAVMLANTTSEYDEVQKKALNQIDGTQDLVSLNQLDQLSFEKKMALYLLPLSVTPLIK